TGTQRTGRNVLKCLFGSVDEFDRDTFRTSNATYHDVTIGEIRDRGSANTQWWVDVNGDGKSDYCRLLGITVIQCAVSRQHSLQDVKWAESPTKFGTAESRRWGDINGDGAMDMCFDGPTAMKSCVISNGLTGTVMDTGIIRKSIDAPNRHWMVDWNGDGRVDY